MDQKNNIDNTLAILITGGSGFLGKAIVKELLDPHSLLLIHEIRIFDKEPFEGEKNPRINYIQGDVRNLDALIEATRNIDIVIHAAAIVDWGTHSENEVYAINYLGTQNVIKACEQNMVKVLVYTSSLDAVFTGSPLINIGEDYPYPERFPNMYCKSKAMSEVIVKEVNQRKLKTCILRPSDIYGEGDPYHIDSLIDMAKKGFYVRLGNGKARCQHVYVGNMAEAHIQVIRHLLEDNKKIEGNIYFITDGPGENFFKFFDQVVENSGYRIRPKNFWIPRQIAYALGAISEFAALLLRPLKRYNPKFSRFAVTYTCTDYTFSSEKAMKDFGYRPKYSLSEAMERTVSYYRKRKE